MNEKTFFEKLQYEMSYRDNFIKNSRGKTVQNFDIIDIPKGTTLLLFGGYRRPAFYLADGVKNYHKKYGEYPNILITGKSSNKIDNTAGLGSEVNVYHHILKECGIPEEEVKKFYINPIDENTKENTISLGKILGEHPELKDAKIALVTQPYYSRRALHEFMFNMPDIDFAVANVPLSDFGNGAFYNDNLNGSTRDVISACVLNTYHRESRFGEETISPTKEELQNIPSIEEMKPFYEKYCGWLYPNNFAELGINDDLAINKNIITERRNSIPMMSTDEQISQIEHEIARYKKNGKYVEMSDEISSAIVENKKRRR